MPRAPQTSAPATCGSKLSSVRGHCDAVKVDSPFYFWLAGLIDGEGSFDVRRQHGSDGWQTSLRLALRGDDADVIAYIRAASGLGTVTTRRWGGRDIVTWNVYARADARRLAAILDEHPLRSKKRRDFELWRQAVELEPRDARHARLALALREGRARPADAAPLHA